MHLMAACQPAPSFSLRGFDMRCKNGFTLIEIAVVLVIIGLVAGSIVGAHSMIRSAQMRNVLVELDNYTKAIGEFQDRYKQLPGDMPYASSYWPGVVDGNGTGRIDNPSEWFAA